MIPLVTSINTTWLFLVIFAIAQPSDPQLVGTWTSKSAAVFTGPKFYTPSTGEIHEPSHTGISYSFTQDGHYEESIFRAISNPVDPSCPGAVIQWQHGAYVQAADSSLKLMPISSDGRQILSQPCKLGTSILTRYSQSENFTKATVQIDPYKNLLRLDIYQWDGTPVIPMWLAQKDPIMLPTTTLTPRSSSKGFKSLPSRSPKEKRATSLDQGASHKNIRQPVLKRTFELKDCLFWVGLGCLGVGNVLYFFF